MTWLCLETKPLWWYVGAHLTEGTGLARCGYPTDVSLEDGRKGAKGSQNSTFAFEQRAQICCIRNGLLCDSGHLVFISSFELKGCGDTFFPHLVVVIWREREVFRQWKCWAREDVIHF